VSLLALIAPANVSARLRRGLTMTMDFLEDDVVVAQRFAKRQDLESDRLYGHFDRQMLGFHHENKNPRRTHLHIHRPPPAALQQERQLRIRA
jgi:ubiquitin carboxyl-terminal hydrolase 7